VVNSDFKMYEFVSNVIPVVLHKQSTGGATAPDSANADDDDVSK